MSSPNTSIAGVVRKTTDGVLGTSGAETRVFAIHLVSNEAASTVRLLNGTTDSGTEYLKETGVTGTGVTVNYGDKGILFPAGCYVDVDTNITSVLISYSQ